MRARQIHDFRLQAIDGLFFDTPQRENFSQQRFFVVAIF
jgi:hypothetical protein